MHKAELDKITAIMDAPDYPAGCDNCGQTGTNATMMTHQCASVGEPPTVSRLIEWYETEARRIMQLIQTEEWKDAGEQLIGYEIGRSHTLGQVASDLRSRCEGTQ